MAASEISLTIKLDEDDWKAIERLSMTIEKRLERLEAIVDARGLDWDHPRVADEPPKKWRILEPGEVVQEGDWYADAFYPRQCWPPSKGAWLEVKVDLVKVGEVATSGLVFARPVSDELAKEAEPEHPAGPMPDPGEGYRLLSKDPPEDLQPGDEYQPVAGHHWYKSPNAHTHRKQGPGLWYRRKIEVAEPPEPEYREPVLPADYGMVCEFSDDGETWGGGCLRGWSFRNVWVSDGGACWRHARIKKDA